MTQNNGVEDKKDALERAKTQLMKIKGVIGVAELTHAQCDAISCLEEEAMQHVLGGIGRGRNEGLKKSLGYGTVLGIFTDASFELPNDPELLLLISDGEVVGFGTADQEVINRYKRDKGYAVLSDFLVMKRGARINHAAFCSGEAYFLFRGTTSEALAGIGEIKDHFMAIPSPPVFGFLKEQFRETVDLNDPQAAVFIVGVEFR